MTRTCRRSAEHFDGGGDRVHAIPTRTVHNAIKNQTDEWNEGAGGALPSTC